MEVQLNSNNLQKVILALLAREKKKLPWEKSHRNTILGLCVTLKKIRENEANEGHDPVKRLWVKEMYSVENRLSYGASDTFVRTLREQYPDDFYNFFRMPPDLFETLLSIVGPSITKQHHIREPISPRIRLELTIRWLATGDNFETLSALFRVSPSSVSNIINEVTLAIWACLKPLVFRKLNQEEWRKIARGFKNEWDYDHCVGAVDSKLVKIIPPPHCGSLVYDYKGHHSIHLHAIVDAYQIFTLVDVGAAGRQSDGGVFRASKIGQMFINNQMDLPPPEPLIEGGPDMPWVLVADEAFGLSNFCMRPYPRSRAMNLRKKVFNYRLSRARRIVEAAFGTLVRVWQVLGNPVKTTLKVTIQTVHACVCLHNFLIMYDERRERPQREVHNEDVFQVIEHEIEADDPRPREGSLESVRYEFSRYFMNEGAVNFQWDRAMNYNF
ncbi:hypothetical protein QAD02_023422 [Eretmocerus hayati]|uniref:Uncharacterized protein n=1 Tax=Eretmocerus hayati TaxID=131215 RepID=A0ACC2PXF4_9HYME|nr:hypothetical protein QAD02_023422 [Eretmocerus hayati]